MFKSKFILVVVCLLVILGLGTLFFYSFSFSSGAPSLVKTGGRTMGTTWSTRYVLDSKVTQTTEAGVFQAITSALDSINQSMSTYIPDSELMQLNRAPLHQPVTVSKDLFTNVAQAQHVSELSGGAYDVTAGALVNLWGFGSVSGDSSDNATSEEQTALPEQVTEHSQAAFMDWMAKGGVAKAPTKEQIALAKQKTGFKSLILDDKNRTITKTKPVFIDLSSIAKGYGVDKVAQAIESLGVTSYMVEVGGEIRLRGKKPNGQPWKIAVREPVLENRINTIVTADNKAIATSGDYLNYYEVNGVHFSHLIDARTGYPEQHRLASVAVIANETSLADAYATMLMVLGDEKGIALAERQNIDAYFIYHTDKGFASKSTGNFDSYRVDQ